MKDFGEAVREELPGFTPRNRTAEKAPQRYISRHPSGQFKVHILGVFAVTLLPDYWQPAEMLAA